MKNLFRLFVIFLIFLCSCSSLDDVEQPIETESKYFTINSESLNGWEYGIADGEYCIVYKKDDAGLSTICAINTLSSSDYSFWVDFDGNGAVIGFATPYEYYSVKEEADKYIFYSYQDGGLICINVDKVNNSVIEKQIHKSHSLSRAGNGFSGLIESVYNVYDAVGNSSNLANDLHDGRWGDFFTDLGDMIGQGIIDKLTNGGLAGILLSEQINFLQNELNRHNSEELYGSSQIKITSIDKQIDESYIVNAEVSGLASVKSILGILSETSYQEVENHIYAGIVCRKNYPAFVNYYTYKSNETEVKSSGSTVYLSFQIPKLDKGKYFVKPYLRSSINEIIQNSGFNYINYGSEVEINVIGGKISKIEQLDVTCVGSAVAKFVLYADTEIDSNENIEDWGVYYIDHGQYKRFSASWPTSKIKDDVRIELELSRSDFDDVNYNTFKATKEMSFGVFKKLKNAQGVYDYGFYEYGDLTSFTITYDTKPSLELFNTHVLSNVNKSYEDWDRYCTYEFAISTNGCFFVNSIVLNSGNNWHSAFGETLIEGPKDNSEYNFSNSYYYYSKGTSVGEVIFAAVLGNGVLHEFPVRLYCDNGSVYTGGSSRSKNSKSSDNKSLISPFFGK